MKGGILAAAALLVPSPAPAECAAPPDRPTLVVRGSATVDRRPDKAEVTIALETRGPTLDAAQRAHRARVSQAAAFLAAMRGKGVAVDEGTFDLSEERSPPPDGARPGAGPVSYRATTRYALTIPTLDRLDGVVADIAAAGLFEVDSAVYAVADQPAALDDARRAAVGDARRRAEVYAEAAGMRLDGVERIGDGEAQNTVTPAFRLAAGSPGAASVGIAPPKALEFTDSVTMTWRIAPR